MQQDTEKSTSPVENKKHVRLSISFLSRCATTGQQLRVAGYAQNLQNLQSGGAI